MLHKSGKCIECGMEIDWNPRSYLCEECFDWQLKSSRDDEPA